MNINPLIDKSAKFKIKNTIEWHIGWIEDKFADALFTKADLIVMPYKNIDGSGVLVQSIEYNVPCVASNIGGFSELIQNHKTGFLIDPVNSTSLRNIFFDILKNPNILNDIRTEIRKEALNLPTWDDMAKYVISLDISQN